MSLRASWVDSLFAKLTVRYGASFLRQYADIEAETVKADWAEVLDGFECEDIAYALRFLPADRPPNAMQFREQCRRAPRGETYALPAPECEPASSEKVQSIVSGLREKWAEAPRDMRAWARRLREREESGDRTLTLFQREAWRMALR